MVNITHSNYDKGFTLVELAIALMVIGLLIGGVLKGQELIENAKVTAAIRQVKAYDTATLIFRNTYNALPGDIKRPNRIPNCTEEICTIGGNGNGKLLWNDTTPNNIETYNFFPHLTKAGMIQGPEGGTQAEMSLSEKFFPGNPWGEAKLYMQYYSSPPATVYMADLSSTISPPPNHYYRLIAPFKSSEQIDTKLDDGLPCSGNISIEDVGDCLASGNSYQEQLSMEGDAIRIPAGF